MRCVVVTRSATQSTPRHLQRGAMVRAAGRCDLDVRYGSGPRATLDIYHAADSSRLLVFVHGGYWRALDKTYVAFIAEAYRRAGITVAMPGYDLVPDLRIEEIADQIRRLSNSPRIFFLRVKSSWRVILQARNSPPCLRSISLSCGAVGRSSALQA